MTINERVKHLRKEIMKQTQQTFSDEIKISRSNLGNIETGEVAVTERVFYSICEKFNVNEEWLRTGEGKIFVELSKENQLMEWAGNVLKDESDSFKRRFVNMLMELDDSDWETLEKIALKLHNEKARDKRP